MLRKGKSDIQNGNEVEKQRKKLYGQKTDVSQFEQTEEFPLAPMGVFAIRLRRHYLGPK